MKVLCVKPRHKKWQRFTPRECKHEACVAAAVARRIKGPVTPGIENMAQALKNVYEKHIAEHMAERQNALLRQMSDEGKEYYGYWQTAPILFPQEETQEADAGDGQGSSKPDRG